MRRYTKTFRIKDSFPIETGERWNVVQGNQIVEHWLVDFVNDKNTLADIVITELTEDENAIHFE